MTENWIRFDKAVTLLKPRYGSRDVAAKALLEKLSTGALASVAGEITRYENCDSLGGGGTPAVHRLNWRIPKRLWKDVSLVPLFGSNWTESTFRALRTDIDWGRRSGLGGGLEPKVVTTSYGMRLVEVDGEHIATLVGPLTPATAAERAKPGRKPKFDWPAFDHHAHSRLEYNGGFLGIDWAQTDLEGEMQAWALDRWGTAPGESTIRDRITKTILPAFEAKKAGQK